MITSRTDMGNAVELRSVGKKYPYLRTQDRVSRDDTDDFWALTGVSCDVSKGRILGVIGRNGAGKTTFLNLISGVLNPTRGTVASEGRILGLFNLGVGFQDELTGRENIFLNGSILGASRNELDRKLSAIIEFSELGDFIDMPLGTYSQGMRLRLGFSIIASLDCDILVIDEILAVGDTLFQSKCYERLMDFKRLGKTLIISSQNLELIERLCDSVILLAHGRQVFVGAPPEAVQKYRELLSSEKFFVGPSKKAVKLVEATKRWAGDSENWGKELGSKEIVIDKVEFLNSFGWRASRIKCGDCLKVRVRFTARNAVAEPHFGVAIFKDNGVYCYGPNTSFDGCYIPEVKPGAGWFILDYRNLFLAPGDYRVSVAIWDKNETVAFAYNHGCYRLSIEGSNRGEQLFEIPCCCVPAQARANGDFFPDSQAIKEDSGVGLVTGVIRSIRVFDRHDAQNGVFMTADPARVVIEAGGQAIGTAGYLWTGLFRDDGVYCQGFIQPFEGDKGYSIRFPGLLLLPGGYYFSAGIWDAGRRAFTAYHGKACPFRVVFDREDHGTLYMKHEWKWGLP